MNRPPQPPPRPPTLAAGQLAGLAVMAFGVWLEASYDGFMLDWRFWVILASVIAGPTIAERIAGGGGK